MLLCEQHCTSDNVGWLKAGKFQENTHIHGATFELQEHGRELTDAKQFRALHHENQLHRVAEGASLQ